MKEAITLPGLKPDSDRTKPESFRPISLTPHLSKIFGRVMKEKLQNHLEKNNLIGNFQHGFRAERSCLSQLLEFYEYVLQCMEEGFNIDVIFLDLAKAFDKVDHGLLAHRMKQKRIGGKVGV